MKQEAENARMMALYRQHILGEKAPEAGGFVALESLGGKAAEKEEEVMGD